MITFRQKLTNFVSPNLKLHNKHSHCDPIVEIFHIFLFIPLNSMNETDDSSKTDPESDLSRAVTANKLFPPGIDDDK